jgi:hypothetical protein
VIDRAKEIMGVERETGRKQDSAFSKTILNTLYNNIADPGAILLTRR